MSENVIFGINGPVVTLKGETELCMKVMVYVGNEKLIDEVKKRHPLTQQYENN